MSDFREKLISLGDYYLDKADRMYGSMIQTQEMSNDISLCLALAMSRNLREDNSRYLSKDMEEDIVVAIYAEFGLKPKGKTFPSQWQLWVKACECGDDLLAMRLLEDGFNPNRRQNGYHSARNYAQKNWRNLPRTWSYFCQQDLAKKAAKARKRSWAGGTYTERAM